MTSVARADTFQQYVKRRMVEQPLCFPGSINILLISSMHIMQAALISASANAANATGLLAVMNIFFYFKINSALVVAAVLLTTALVAAAGALMRFGRGRIFLFLPQHFLLGTMAIGGIAAMMRGAYLDGTVIPWPHIAADQITMTILFAIHSIAIFRRSRFFDG